jgi:hypothetical protein
MDLDLLLRRNETKNLYQTTALYFGPLSFKVLLMCRLTEPLRLVRPMTGRRPVFSKLSKLLNQEDALSGLR